MEKIATNYIASTITSRDTEPSGTATSNCTGQRVIILPTPNNALQGKCLKITKNILASTNLIPKKMTVSFNDPCWNKPPKSFLPKDPPLRTERAARLGGSSARLGGS